MIDFGADWLTLLSRVSRSAILLTHAIPTRCWPCLRRPLSGLRFHNPYRLLGRYPRPRSRIGPALGSSG